MSTSYVGSRVGSDHPRLYAFPKMTGDSLTCNLFSSIYPLEIGAENIPYGVLQVDALHQNQEPLPRLKYIFEAPLSPTFHETVSTASQDSKLSVPDVFPTDVDPD